VVKLGELRNTEDVDEQQDCMGEAIIVVEESGNIQIANSLAKELLGLSRECTMAAVKTALVDLGLRQLLTRCDTCVEKDNGRLIAKSSRGKILQITWSAINDPASSFRGNIIIIRDTTAQTELDKVKNYFLASLSHELRTPLTTIQNLVSNIYAGVTGKVSKKMQKYLQMMDNSCQRFNRLINDLLDAIKLETGDMPINCSSVDLAEIANNAVAAFMESAQQKNLDLSCNIDGHIPPIYADSGRIYQVLSNLIENAIRYTAPAGRVTVRLHEKNNSVITMVEDTGVGIPSESKKLIFDKFYQVSHPAGPGYNGWDRVTTAVDLVFR